MKFSTEKVVQGVNILANDHYVAIPYDCSDVTATNGIIPAGTILPANDGTAKGVLLSDVDKNKDPNGAIVIHGFIDTSKLPEAPSEDTTGENAATGAKSALKQITFI